MKIVRLSPNQTVAEVIGKYPETIPTWMSLKMGCIGCLMMRFCSLSYAAESYQVEVEKLLDELEKRINHCDVKAK